jgi:hypothetical protein
VAGCLAGFLDAASATAGQSPLPGCPCLTPMKTHDAVASVIATPALLALLEKHKSRNLAPGGCFRSGAVGQWGLSGLAGWLPAPCSALLKSRRFDACELVDCPLPPAPCILITPSPNHPAPSS